LPTVGGGFHSDRFRAFQADKLPLASVGEREGLIVTVKEHIKRDLCWLPLMAAFIYVCELARETWCPTVPMLVVIVLSVLFANALRKRAVLSR
jgi:hypothetical protein